LCHLLYVLPKSILRDAQLLCICESVMPLRSAGGGGDGGWQGGWFSQLGVRL